MDVYACFFSVLLFRLILGGIFIYASPDKITHPEQFAKIVYNYNILPHSLINIFAIIMPWMELICGFFLITRIFVT
ncbi:MAG: DoxX family membrane protein [candidate division Zixibacteria bacterium]|nr:DoxX family membrane protein [candidate division Zixibacteria bacterium]